MSSPQDQPLPPEPPRLRRLRLLVTVLTATMIIGLIVIIGSIVITLTGSPKQTQLTLPAELDLPSGETLDAITKGKDWIAAVTTHPDGSQHIHILDPQNGKLLQSIKIQAK